jgi:hypothetical protein
LAISAEGAFAAGAVMDNMAGFFFAEALRDFAGALAFLAFSAIVDSPP